MMFTNHPYRHPLDFARLNSFLSQVRPDVSHSHYLHCGDLTWQLFHMLADYPPANLIQMWEVAQEHILGFVLLYPPYGFFDPNCIRNSAALLLKHLCWRGRRSICLPAAPRLSMITMLPGAAC